MTERTETAMSETTTLQEMAYCLSVNEPGATFEEHLEFLQEAAEELGLSTDPRAPLSDVDATTVLETHAREADPEEGPDPDAAYDRWLDTQLGA
jgi:hypothetical protein